MFKAQASEAAVAYWPMHCNAGDKLVEIVNEMQLMLQTRQGQMRSIQRNIFHTLYPEFKKHRKNCECCPVSQLIVR